jgi:predicted RNA binding protein YcfA (HicA-like mRNA interferase family)
MKVSEIVRLARNNGCVIQRHGSKHDIWLNPETGSEVSIPRHQSKELPTGTANQILKKLGLA